MSAKTLSRENVTARARALRIATSDIEHLDDRAYANVVASRAHSMTRDRARQLAQLIAFSAELPWDRDQHRDASAAALDALDTLHAVIEKWVPQP